MEADRSRHRTHCRELRDSQYPYLRAVRTPPECEDKTTDQEGLRGDPWEQQRVCILTWVWLEGDIHTDDNSGAGHLVTCAFL